MTKSYLYCILFFIEFYELNMESRWYLFPGQTLENTKISDRVHALYITKTAWDGITKHLDRKKLMQEAADKEAAIKHFLDEGSKNMTKGWENSLENVRKRKEEERLKMIEQKKDDRQQRFLEMRKEQEQIRKAYMDKVKKQIFMTTGHARDLTSALVTSEVLFEREKQLEFQNKIKYHEKEEEQIWAERLKQGVKEEFAENEEKKKLLLEKNKKHGETLKQMVATKKQLAKKIKEKRVQKEAADNIEAVKEMEKLEQIRKHDQIIRKNELFEEKQKYLRQLQDFKDQKNKEEKELDEVVQIYQEAKHRIDCLRKQREQEMRNEVLKRQELITKLVMVEQQDASAAEEKLMKKAIAEKEEIELQKIKEKLEFQEKMKQERLENIREVHAREIEKKKREEEIKKWALLNRYKADEHMQKYEDDKRKKLWQEILRYRQDLCQQMQENKVELEREKNIEEAYFKASLEEDDAKFFQYANEVLELAKKKGRSIIPIERVITKYIKQMNVDPEHYGTHIDSTNPCENKALDIKKKLIKPQKQRQCGCYCPKK